MEIFFVSQEKRAINVSIVNKDFTESDIISGLYESTLYYSENDKAILSCADDAVIAKVLEDEVEDVHFMNFSRC